MINLDNLIEEFLDKALKYGTGIKEGKNTIANKAHKRITSLYLKIDKLNGNGKLKKLLEHSDDGVRLCASSFLIHYYEDISVKTLNEIIDNDNIYSSIAVIVMDLWEKGNLKKT